jgi:hypothetical protein
MYDIEFVIPVTGQGKFGQRIVDLKKMGLLNIKDRKVLLTLLVGPEKIPNIEIGWPPNITVQIIPGEHKQETAKTYEFFSLYREDFLENVRWIAKIDDDTINDVDNLIKCLDLEYDHTREYYVITEFRPEQHRYEDDLLKKIGFSRWFNPKNKIWHELEACVVSQAAMKRMIKTPKAIELMKLRSKTPEGYNDYCLACAARICKIYPSDAYFLCRHPHIGDFSLFGGHLCHLHDISHDKNSHAFDLIQRMMNKDVSCGTEIYKEIVNKEFLYHNWQGMHMIKLRDDGIIEGPGDARIWHIKPNSHMEFLQNDGTLVAVFDNYENSNLMRGYSTHPHSQNHKPYIRKLA